MINTDKIKSYLILKNQRHQRSICRKIGISLMLLLTVAWVNAGFDGSASLTTRIDSLKQVIATAKEDTTRINALNALGWELMYTNPDTSIILYKEALKLCNNSILQEFKKIDDLKANNHSDIGVYYRLKGDYTKSLYHNLKALEIRKELSNSPDKAIAKSGKHGVAISLGNIGLVYDDQGYYPKALKHYQEALEIDKEVGNKKGMARHLGNIGLVYNDHGNYANAMKHYNEALELYKELGNTNDITAVLSNIGNVLMNLGDHATRDSLRQTYYANAMKHYQEALEIDKEVGNKKGMAIRLGNIALVYKNLGKYPMALNHYHEALDIDMELGRKSGIAIRLGNIGALYTILGQFEDAKVYLDSALTIDIEIGRLSGQMHRHQALSHLYDTLAGNSKFISPEITRQKSKFYKLAYEHYKKYSAAKDSLFNEEKSKEIGRLEQKHEFEMAEIERKQKEKMVAAALAAATTRRNLLQYSAILIGIFLFFGLILLMGKLNVPVWVVEASVFMLFLLIFEFTLVLLDPTIDGWTGGAPAYKLLLNAALAGLIFPVHGLCERLLKKKIMERR